MSVKLNTSDAFRRLREFVLVRVASLNSYFHSRTAHREYFLETRSFRRKASMILLGAFVVVTVGQTIAVTAGKSNARPSSEQVVPEPPVLLPALKSRAVKDELTTVTAFFNIEEYATNQVQPELTKDQMQVFSLIESPVVGYFDDDEYLNAFVQSRKYLQSHLTVAHKISRDQMWSFGLVPEIERIFQKPDYPKHNPQTVVARYAAATHAKYEVLQWAVKENPFKTRYFSWLDAGFFRDLAPSKSRFALYLPPRFDAASVAYLQVQGARKTAMTVADILRNDLVWVSARFFVAEATVMYRWTAEYKDLLHQILKGGWIGADYHVIYASFNTLNTTTKIQAYKPKGVDLLYLANLARVGGLKKQRSISSA